MSELKRAMSRPTFQRIELGPIVAVVTEEMFDFAKSIAEQYATPELTKGVMNNNADYLYCLRRAMAGISNDTTEFKSASSLAQSLSETGIFEHVDVPMAHYVGSQLLHEGFRSGLTTPVRLYELLLSKKYISTPYEQFDIDVFSNALTSDWFDNLLHQLADLPNGLLGSWGVYGGTPNSFVRGLKFVMLGNGGYDFSNETKGVLKNVMARNNREARAQPSLAQESGGCPVRHKIYKKIGPAATSAFLESGTDISKLADPSRLSAITMGRNFVAEATQQFYEGFDATLK